MLSRPLTIVQALERVKSYLGLPFVRVAIGEGKTLGKSTDFPSVHIALKFVMF